MSENLSASQKRVLLIEDEIGTAELLIEFLGMRGFLVDHAKDGIEGLEMSLSVSPDLILLDMMLPGMEGIDVLREIRKETSLNPVPVLMCTANADTKPVELCRKWGAQGYIPKPFNLARTYQMISDAIHKPNWILDGTGN